MTLPQNRRHLVINENSYQLMRLSLTYFKYLTMDNLFVM